MNVTDAIKARRAYRAIEPFQVTDELIRDLVFHASLAPSCFNRQPWRFIFLRDPSKLFEALSRGNEWVRNAGMIVVVYSKRDDDCVVSGREYYSFDTGMAVAFMILRATELGLVAHPIAGYDEKKVKEVLGIPEEYTVITMIVMGKHNLERMELLTDKQREIETNRPPRFPFEEIAKVI